MAGEERAWSAPEGRRIHLVGRGSTWVREVAGPPGAPTVILLHGLGATATLNWPGAFDVLSRRYRVIALDHRGHGRGMRTRGPFRLVDCADDVVALADALEIEQIVPVGYSMGGPVAMLARHRHPRRVAGLVLGATAAVFRREDPRPANAAYAAALATSLRFTPPIVRRRITATLVDAARRRGTLPAAVAYEARHHDPAAIVEAARAVAGFDGRHWIGGLGCPAAVVVTGRDSLVPPHRQRELAELLHAPTFTVDGDHDVCARHPLRFLSAIDDACASVISELAHG
jgi:3-oxoadipate enol-lactonase